MGRMGFKPILPITVPITMGTMLNFDGDFDGHGYGDVTYEQTLKD